MSGVSQEQEPQDEFVFMLVSGLLVVLLELPVFVSAAGFADSPAICRKRERENIITRATMMQ